jgi:hypothetical protein
VRQYLLLEILTLLGACLPLVSAAPLHWCLLPWALAPLVALLGTRLGPLRTEGFRARTLLPHFGSTAAIGISTYVFRISIVLALGKLAAGELFTAFAIGGLIPTVFGHAFAPSLAWQLRGRAWPRKLLLVPLSLFLVAAVLLSLTLNFPDLAHRLGRSQYFLIAVALSVMGGALMCVALALRTRLLQGATSEAVYGPDLLANVLIATSVPFVHLMFGSGALAGMYLASGFLNLAFFVGTKRTRPVGKWRSLGLALVAALLVLPVFLQVDGGLFSDPSLVFNAAGEITRVPLPLSIAATFIGMVVLGNYSAATRSLTALFFTMVLFVMTSLLLAAGNQANESAKLLLLAQFLLPMFGLVLGEMFGAAAPQRLFERAVLLALLAVLTAQMLATWSAGSLIALPKVFIFSIYQHFQYFPMLVAAVVSMAGMAVWDQSKRWRLAAGVLWSIAAIQLVASQSSLALAAAAAGLALFCIWHGRQPRMRRSVILVAGITLALAGAYALTLEGKLPGLDLAAQGTSSSISAHAKPATDKPRLYVWQEYASGASGSVQDFFLGHRYPPDRRHFPSAYNYWLDALYNFGAVSIFPLLLLLMATAAWAWAARTEVLASPILAGNLFALAYLVLLENMVSVGMRQPYPGLVTFFIWGLAIARLRQAASANAVLPTVTQTETGAPGAAGKRCAREPQRRHCLSRT